MGTDPMFDVGVVGHPSAIYSGQSAREDGWALTLRLMRVWWAILARSTYSNQSARAKKKVR